MSDWRSALSDERLIGRVRDISMNAVITLSSCKTGCGVSQLLDENMSTYWQSDGAQPHSVNMQLAGKTPLAAIALYVDYKTDESYTPSKICVRLGNDENDMRQVAIRELDEPVGWTFVDLRDERGMASKAFIMQLLVMQNHQNGRDTHIRHIKLLSPLRNDNSKFMI